MVVECRVKYREGGLEVLHNLAPLRAGGEFEKAWRELERQAVGELQKMKGEDRVVDGRLITVTISAYL